MSREQPVLMLLGGEKLAKPLRERGISVHALSKTEDLLRARQSLGVRIIVVDAAAVEEGDITALIGQLRALWSLVDVVLWAPHADASLVRGALQAGAKDVMLTTSAEACSETILEIIEGQQLLPRARRVGSENTGRGAFEGMISRSPRMWDLFDTASQVAKTEATVLVLGETGTGKELLARAVHRRSQRDGRFVAVNCAAVSESLVDSELFGHVEGAFTGATHATEGLFRLADKGTLMLDEIGNIPLSAQHRLLRVLQEGAVRPVGGELEISVDVRVLAATSTSLEDDVRSGQFREDLFYRLDVIRLEIPPLRQRPEDIIFLFAHFAKRVSEQYNIARPDVSDDFLDALVDYQWPGNVRQLENFTERLVLTQTSRRATAAHFRELVSFKRGDSKATPSLKPPVHSAPAATPELDIDRTLEETLRPQVEALERAYLEACLRQTGGRMGSAAERAGISRRTLLRKLKSHGLQRASFREQDAGEED
jgi:DNA-binding NtrC family response regulator